MKTHAAKVSFILLTTLVTVGFGWTPVDAAQGFGSAGGGSMGMGGSMGSQRGFSNYNGAPRPCQRSLNGSSQGGSQNGSANPNCRRNQYLKNNGDTRPTTNRSSQQSAVPAPPTYGKRNGESLTWTATLGTPNQPQWVMESTGNSGF